MSKKTTIATPPVEMKKEQGWNTNTEICVNLKTKLCNDKVMKAGKRYRGVLMKDVECEDYGYEEHMTFTETQSQPVRRNPHIFAGRCINVKQATDGTLYPTFNRPRFTSDFTFQDFCRKAAEELIYVTGLVEK